MEMASQPAPKVAPKAKKTKPEPVARVKRGSVEIEIFPIVKKVGDKEYQQFEFTFYRYAGAPRERVRRADLEEAKQEAELVATKLSNGEAEVLKLTSTDRAIYVQAVDTLRTFNPAIPLNLAISDYVAAAKCLPPGTTLREAVEFFLKRNPASLPQKTIQQIVDELVSVKDGNSESDLKDLRGRGGQFADKFQMPISQVTGTMIEVYLDGLELAARTLKNHLGVITRIFRFAVRRKYLTKDALEELEVIELPDGAATEIAIFSPAEMQELLAVARPEIIPWLVIGAFCGLRSAELQRLDWAQVNLEERHVEVLARNAKTRSRRIVPIPENAVEWLRPYAQSAGPVAAFDNMAKQIVKLTQDVNAARQEQAAKTSKAAEVFTWKRNGLRHSFISYRVALVKDVEQVSFEAGNSPNMIFQHYRKVVTEAEAGKWFAIRPVQNGNIIPMPQATVVA